MDRRRWPLLLLVLAVALSWAVRLNNAWTYPALRAFDGFGHFTYVWFMAENWRVPLPTSGWSFFHPPVYYWIFASIWTAFDQMDPFLRLRIGTTLTATLGLTQGIVAYRVVRRYLPDRPLLPLLAAVLMLFLPVHLFTAGYLGNESLNAWVCTVSFATLLWVLRAPSWRRGLLLGALLGTALLTKFTSIAFVAGSFGALGLRTLFRRDWKNGVATIVAVAAVMAPLCGWFYARNIRLYGDPFKVSRDEFMVRRHENLQTSGRRDLAEYLLFDPLIVYRPQWPRGIPQSLPLPPGIEHSRLRESVWTGLFANAFFDAVGNQVLPPVNNSEESRRAGQLMLLLGLVPTSLVLVGIATAIGRLLRHGWNDTLGAVLLTFTLMIATFVHATRSVPMNAAVKATYMTPAAVLFAFWFALGADRLVHRFPWTRRALAAWAVVFAVSSSVVFSNGVFIARGWLDEAHTASPVWKSIYGLVYYAAGWRDRAREMFEPGILINWHLAYENAAAMALEDGDDLEALYQIRSATKFQPQQSYGLPDDRATYDRITRAEYLNTTAVAYDRLGWHDEALAAAREAHALDPTIPEVNYDLAVLVLKSALRPDGTPDPAKVPAAVAEARPLIFAAAAGDAGFFDARALAGSASLLEGNCDEGMRTIAEALAPHPGQYRFYPVATGTGDIQSAALKRRVQIERLPAALRPDAAPPWCRRANAPRA